MTRCLLTLLCILLGLLPRLPWAHGGECVVESAAPHAGASGSLPALLRAVTEKGKCLTESLAYRKEYEPYLGMALQFHMIRWTKSMEIHLTEPLPPFQGHDGRPLILRVDPGIQVRLVGGAASPMVVEGEGGPVILDGLRLSGFAGTAIALRSDDNAIIRGLIQASGTSNGAGEGMPALLITGARNRVAAGTEIIGNRGPGILIREAAPGGCGAVDQSAASRTRIAGSVIAENGGDGIVIDAHGTILADNQIHDNSGHGVLVRTESAASRCAIEAGQPVPAVAWQTALGERNRFWANGGEAFTVTAHPLVAPIDLIVVTPPTAATLTLIGNIGRALSERSESKGRVDDPAYPWGDTQLNFQALRVEVYLAEDATHAEGRTFLTSVTPIDPMSRQWIVHLPLPLRSEGQPLTNPVFTATLVDTENGNTSPFATPVDTAASSDWDRDGIANAEEDLNHDGGVDVGETDPRLPDTDGDGILDGAERSQRLDPRSSDSDGDCLPDGLELGVGLEQLPPWQPAAGSVLQRPRIVLTAACEAGLRKRSVLRFANAVPWNSAKPPTVENIAALYDTDPTTRTDPTNADTDHDLVADGAEDWNWDGARTAKNLSPVAGLQSPENPLPVDAMKAATLLMQSAGDQRPATGDAVWLETDPTLADSDRDGFQDGEEGDRNADGQLDPTETDPLRGDTDGDGIDDATEVRKFGSTPNDCDSDDDGLADGLEAGVLNPHPFRSECVGLQTAGSNFASLGGLNMLVADSDNDGLPDGAEDTNHNGWLDPLETDPTTADMDRDGLSDYLEVTGDLDGDGITDIDLTKINNGPRCSPPPTILDLDCDGAPNAADEDADNDGCGDREEGLSAEGDPNGTPAAFNAKVKSCRTPKAAPGPSAAPGPAPDVTPPPAAASAEAAYFAGQIKGGGSCALIPRR